LTLDPTEQESFAKTAAAPLKLNLMPSIGHFNEQHFRNSAMQMAHLIGLTHISAAPLANLSQLYVCLCLFMLHFNYAPQLEVCHAKMEMRCGCLPRCSCSFFPTF